MRRISVFVLAAALLAPAPGSAARLAPDDGTVIVRAANGLILIRATGVLFGHFDSGTLTFVEDYVPDDNERLPAVSGARKRLVGQKALVVYTGTDVRFFFPAGRYTLRFVGAGIDFSAVGSGTVIAIGKGTLDDGTISVNRSRPLPLDPTAFFTAAFGAERLRPSLGAADTSPRATVDTSPRAADTSPRPSVSAVRLP